MKVPCVIRAVYLPGIGIICRRCYLDEWSGVFEFVRNPLLAHVSGFCDEPNQAAQLFGKLLKKDPFYVRKLWTHNGLPGWVSAAMSDLGYPPYDRNFPVQPLTSGELKYWAEHCWICEDTWLTNSVIHDKPIPEGHQEVSMIRAQVDSCIGCVKHDFVAPCCGECGKPLRY